MSGIPTNIITVQFPDDGGDPADGGGSFDSGPILDVLRGVQVNVGNINQNVRAILEVLRRMSTMRGGAAGAAGTRAGGDRARGEMAGRRAGSRARFSSDIMEYRQAIRGGARLGDIMRESHEDLLGRYRADRESLSPRELRAATRLRGVELFGEQVAGRTEAAAERINLRDQMRAQRDAIRAQQAAQREHTRAQRDAIRAQRAAQRAAAQAQREQTRAAARAAAENVRGSRNRMAGDMASRMAELRRRAAMPGANLTSLGITEEEWAVMQGRASPSGLPGTRAHFRGIGGMVAGMAPPPPGQQMSMGAGIMRMVTMVGRVLATAGMVVGLLTRIWQALNAMSRMAMEQRQNFSRIDPVFATMEAQYRVAALKADMMVAQDPSVRAAQQQFTNAQIARTQTGVGFRKAGSIIMAQIGTGYENFMLGLELQIGGLLSGNLQQWALGGTSMIGYLFSPVIGAYIQSWVLSQITKNAPTQNQYMIAPLIAMTGGRFDVNRAYVGRNATKDNWWTGRP